MRHVPKVTYILKMSNLKIKISESVAKGFGGEDVSDR